MIIAWHGEEKLKAAALGRLREHRRCDELVQGSYWDRGRGCLLGCLTHDNDNSHESAERLFGIDQRVGYLLEVVFESLPPDECGQWVLDSAEAIPTGADLSRLHHHFGAWLMGSELLTITDANRAAINQVREYHLAAIAGEATESQRLAARFAARSAAWSLESESESVSAAWSSAESSAKSAPWSAQSAVRSAMQSDAQSPPEARLAAWRSIARRVLVILRDSPIVNAPTECPECVTEALESLRPAKRIELQRG